MDSRSEKEVSDAIVDAAVKKGRNGADVRKHLMTILHDWVISVNGQDDNSDLLLRRKMPPSEYEEHIKYNLKTAFTQTQNSSCVVWPSHNDVPARDKPPIFEPRVHRRLVFKEVGQPLNKIRDQKVLAQCLTEALEGLSDFYLAKYVHRDISSGNLLRCKLDDGGYICKISDLEYARPRLVEQKQNADSKPQDSKTGTPGFMAVEVQFGRYVLRPSTRRSR
ncbi:hypothetical protein PM082_009176 [Marasmius tenuissimus]|nr:hypothetical protein PM082_009176 [Marasmius tenuissimus]